MNKVSLNNISQIYKNNFKKIFLYKIDKNLKMTFLTLIKNTHVHIFLSHHPMGI